MRLEEFDKKSITRFKGLYSRGSSDLTPDDHATDLVNMKFDRSGEVYTREGIGQSLNLTHQVTRMFLATPKLAGYTVLTFDGVQNIFAYDTVHGTETTLMTDSFLQEFAAINMFGKVYILPMGVPSNPMKLMVWDGVRIRPALGLPPATAFVAGTGPTTVTNPIFGVTEFGDPGVIDAGLHRFAVSFITDTGFVTRPGPEPPTMGFDPVGWPAPGGTTVNLTSIPIGGSEVVAREIFVTRAGQEEFYHVAGGYIADNTTTSLQLNFYDTDLVISADDLFDLRDTIDSAEGDVGGIFKFHGRMIVWGRKSPTSANEDGTGDLIYVSEPGDPESFNKVHGWIQLPTEYDGNTVRSAAELRDVLYFMKSVGIYSVQDNLDHPFTWKTIRVDGGCGTGFWGISTIVGSQTALPSGETIVFVDRGGIYSFNGVVQQPQLTWKIKNLWDTIDAANVFKSSICHDPFNQQIYALVPFKISGATKWTLLVADYSEGLTADGIKWSIYQAPFDINAISLMQFQDLTDFDYHLRIGSAGLGGLFKLDRAFTGDLGTGTIDSRYETFLASFGNISIFRALNLRVEGDLYVGVSLKSLDNGQLDDRPTFQIVVNPVQEYTRQINYTAEKMLVRLSGNKRFRVQRVDIYGKTQYMSRPLGI